MPPSEPLDFSTLPPVPPRRSRLATEWSLALAHLRGQRSEHFLSLVTLLSILGIAAGVTIVNAVVAVMTGFEDGLRDQILGANAHVIVFRYGGNLVEPDVLRERVAEVPGVTAVSPFVYSEMMVRSTTGSSGVVVKGIEPEHSGDVLHVRDDLVEGYLRWEPGGEGPAVGALGGDAERHALFDVLGRGFPAVDLDGALLPEAEEPLLPGIFIGSVLRDDLQVRVGDRLLLLDMRGLSSRGLPRPSVRPLRIAGVFHSGMFEYDSKWTYISQHTAQALLGVGDTATGLEMLVDPIEDVERIADEVELRLGHPHYTRNFKELYGKLWSALAMEKWVAGLLLQMLVIIAGLHVVSTLIMMVLTRGRQIAILVAMGASRATIMRVFFLQGAIVGVLGTTLGTAGGLALSALLARYEYPLAEGLYGLSTLPVVIDPTAVLAIAAAALGICLTCTLYPAWRAASLDPVEGLRYG